MPELSSLYLTPLPLGSEGLDNIVVVDSYVVGFSKQPRLPSPAPVRAHVDPGSAPYFRVAPDKVSSIATWLVEPAGTAPASADC